MPRLSQRYGPRPPEMAARIRAERHRLGLSQQEAARRIGILRNTYKNLEVCANPQYSTLVGLVTVLGMDLQALAPEVCGNSGLSS